MLAKERGNARRRRTSYDYNTSDTEDEDGNILQAFQLASTDESGFRDLLVRECTNLAERRGKDFDDYNTQADMLEEMVRLTHLPPLPIIFWSRT
jgi:hypothetical protein